jgi:hypothetical protein
MPTDGFGRCVDLRHIVDAIGDFSPAAVNFPIDGSASSVVAMARGTGLISDPWFEKRTGPRWRRPKTLEKGSSSQVCTVGSRSSPKIT